MCQVDCREQQAFIVLSQEQPSKKAANCTPFRLLFFFLCLQRKTKQNPKPSPKPPQTVVTCISSNNWLLQRPSCGSSSPVQEGGMELLLAEYTPGLSQALEMGEVCSALTACSRPLTFCTPLCIDAGSIMPSLLFTSLCLGSAECFRMRPSSYSWAGQAPARAALPAGLVPGCLCLPAGGIRHRNHPSFGCDFQLIFFVIP